MAINLEKLQAAIHEASRGTYAAGDAALKEKEGDGSTTIRYVSGPYRFHDNYFGGEPYGGREAVFIDNKPVWMMVYYGLVHEGMPAKEVYPFLIESLAHSTIEMPYRGPASYKSGDFIYENAFSGSVAHFSGTEKIYKGGVCVYEASYLGGLVDQ